MGRAGAGDIRFTVNRGEDARRTQNFDRRGTHARRRARALRRSPEKTEGGATTLRPIHRRGSELTPGKADLIEWSKESLVRFDCSKSGQVIWDAFHPARPVDRSRDVAHWMRAVNPGHK